MALVATLITAATTTQRPTEQVSPAPQVNTDAVVWRTAEPPMEPEAGDIWINPKDGMALVYIPAGAARARLWPPVCARCRAARTVN